MTTQNTTTKICFVICPLGEENSTVRKRSDKVLRIIRRALEPLGYKAVRADEIADPGMITAQIIGCLAQCPLVIADLTGANPNVYYELAIRHCVGKPVVQIISKGEKIPFDLRDMRTIVINENEEQLEAVDLISMSVGQIDHTELTTRTPVSVALPNARWSMET